MIYRLITKEQFEFARHEIGENMIGFTWNKSQFTLPTEKEDWENLPQDIAAIPNDRWENEKAMIIERTENELKQLSETVNYVEYISERQCYLFKTETNNYFEIYKTDSITTKDLAIAYVNSLNEQGIVNQLNIAKLSKIKEIKAKAGVLLSESDWKITRHEEQIKINAGTSLTETEFTNLLTERESIREQSNDMEGEVNLLNDIKSIYEYVVSY